MTNEANADWSGYAPSPDSRKHIPHPPSKMADNVGVPHFTSDAPAVNGANADWSGYAPSPHSKKHIPQPTSKIAASVGVEEVKWNPGRRVCENSMSVSASIWGPVPEKNPSVVGSGAWKTEAQAASAQTKTSREQLTENGRSMFIRGKAVPIPAYELARRTSFEESIGARLREENPYSLNENGADITFGGVNEKHAGTDPNDTAAAYSGYSLVGYRSGNSAKSFLDGLGAEVAASVMSSSTMDEEE
jgi:hypothetical protein